MAPTVQDDGFHEIQLNGKQLVFLFMAATVVSVVIFLCGVLVGRGVRAERGGTAENSVASDATAADITPAQAPVTAPAAASADPTAAPPPPQAEDLSYFKRLEDPKQPKEDLKPAASKGGSSPAPTAAQAPAAQAPTPQAAAAVPATKSAPASKAPVARGATAGAEAASAGKDPASADPQPPATPGYAVQIAALNVRSEADAIAKHLTSKGYQAYVSSNGTPAIYRVRIGTFKTRREAETVAAKLQKEEQLKPWVTR